MKAADILEKLKTVGSQAQSNEAESELKLSDLVSDLKMLVADLKKKDNNSAALELEKLMQRYMEDIDLKDQKM